MIIRYEDDAQMHSLVADEAAKLVLNPTWVRKRVTNSKKTGTVYMRRPAYRVLHIAPPGIQGVTSPISNLLESFQMRSNPFRSFKFFQTLLNTFKSFQTLLNPFKPFHIH